MVEAHSNLGMVLKQLGRMPETAEAFEKAVALDPNRADSQLALRGTGRCVSAVMVSGHNLIQQFVMAGLVPAIHVFNAQCP